MSLISEEKVPPTKPPIRPSERRIWKRKPFKSKVRYHCYKGALDLGHNIAVKLLDVSETGIGLVTNMSLAKDHEILILLEGVRHPRPIKTPGSVVWCVPGTDGNYVIGIRFKKYLSYKDLTYLT